jgi:hypothetical protein
MPGPDNDACPAGTACAPDDDGGAWLGCQISEETCSATCRTTCNLLLENVVTSCAAGESCGGSDPETTAILRFIFGDGELFDSFCYPEED